MHRTGPGGSILSYLCQPASISRRALAPVYTQLFKNVSDQPLIAKLFIWQKIVRAESCHSQKCFQNPLPSNLANGDANIFNG